jgi:hypothetical protein
VIMPFSVDCATTSNDCMGSETVLWVWVLHIFYVYRSSTHIARYHVILCDNPLYSSALANHDHCAKTAFLWALMLKGPLT